MSMTYELFVQHALDLKNHSNLIDDDWSICEHQSSMDGSVIKYLVKKKMQIINKSLLNFDHPEFQIDGDSICPIMCEYHVLYNASYACPDVFFNKWYTDGKLLSLENIWCLVHSYFKQNLVIDKWNAITQKEHPINNMPFFRLHPCQSTNILDNLEVSSKNLKINPLVSWLSTISPLIGLELHLSYGHINSNITRT